MRESSSSTSSSKVSTYSRPSKKHRPRTKRVLSPTDMYRTMIADMDEQVGRLLQALRDSGADRDTLVVFTSDNGPERIDGVVGTTAGLRGAKRELYEGEYTRAFRTYGNARDAE